MRRLKARATELYQKGVFRAASSQVVLSGLGRLGENGTRLYGKMKLLWMFNALNLGSKPKSQNLNPPLRQVFETRSLADFRSTTPAARLLRIPDLGVGCLMYQKT